MIRKSWPRPRNQMLPWEQGRRSCGTTRPRTAAAFTRVSELETPHDFAVLDPRCASMFVHMSSTRLALLQPLLGSACSEPGVLHDSFLLMIWRSWSRPRNQILPRSHRKVACVGCRSCGMPDLALLRPLYGSASKRQHYVRTRSREPHKLATHTTTSTVCPGHQRYASQKRNSDKNFVVLTHVQAKPALGILPFENPTRGAR